MGKELIEKGWSRMETTLNKEIPINGSNRSAMLILFLVSFALLIGVGFWFINDDHQKIETEVTTSTLVSTSTNGIDHTLNQSKLKNYDISNESKSIVENPFVTSIRKSQLNESSEQELSSFMQQAQTNTIVVETIKNISNSPNNENENDFTDNQIPLTTQVFQKSNTYSSSKSEKIKSTLSKITENSSKELVDLNNQLLENNALQPQSEQLLEEENKFIKIKNIDRKTNYLATDEKFKINSSLIINNFDEDLMDTPIDPVLPSENKGGMFNLMAYVHSSAPIQLDGGGIGITYHINNNTVSPYGSAGIEYINSPQSVILKSVSRDIQMVEDVAGSMIEADAKNFNLTEESKTTLTSLSSFVNFGIRWKIYNSIFIDNSFGLHYDLSKVNNSGVSFEDDELTNNYAAASTFTKSRLAFKTNFKLGINLNKRLAIIAGYQIALTPEFNFVIKDQSIRKVRLNRINLGMTYNL